MAALWIPGYGDRRGGGCDAGTAHDALPPAGVLLPCKGIGPVPQVVHGNEAVSEAPGKLCEGPLHDAEDKVQPSDPGILHAASGVSCHVQYLRQSIHCLSDHFQVCVFLYQDKDGS